MSNPWNLPKLHVMICRGEEQSDRYRWSVTLMAPDCTGSRELGYRRAGHFSGKLERITYDGNTEVHDHERDVWTPMIPGDRADIQKQITDKLTYAAKRMFEKGENSFERKIADS